MNAKTTARAKTKAKAPGRSSSAGLFANRKISTKISIGFATVIAFTVLISGVAYFEFGAVASQFRFYSHVVHNSGAIDEVDRQFLALQRFVDAGSINADSSAAAVNRARTIIGDELKKAQEGVTDSNWVAKLKEIGSRIETYSKDFEQLTPMRIAHQKLAKGTLEPAGQKLLADLQQLQIDAASRSAAASAAVNANDPNNALKADNASGSSMLFGEAIKISMQLSLYVDKVANQRDNAAVDAAKQSFVNLNLIFAEVEKTSADAGLRKSLDQAKATAKTYSDAFVQFAGQSAAIEKLLNQDMHNIARDVGAATEELRAKSAVNEQRTQRAVSGHIAWATMVILALSIGCLALGIAFAWFIGRVISRPVVALVPQLRKLADGDFNISLPGLGRKDEIGEISAAVEMVVEKVGSTINNIKIAATEVTSASAEISGSTTDLSQRTEEQAASLEETSASMEQISATVKKNAENARQANEFASETNAVAGRGGAVVGEAVSAMARIEESSRKISDIIGVIDEIARQTNLLALNAAVEAARAGEAGRGFAVVASEVRSLAQRSSQAAKDIKDLIVNSTSQVKDGVDLVNKAGASLDEIVASIKKVTDIVADIANASMEQATGLEQINKALTQMDEVTQQNSALVEENAATAKTLEHQAKSMDERVGVFRLRGGESAMEVAEQPVRQVAAGGRQVAPRAPRAPRAAMAVAPSRAAVAPEPKRQPAAAPKPDAADNGTGGPVGRMHAALAAAVNNDPDWKEF